MCEEDPLWLVMRSVPAGHEAGAPVAPSPRSAGASLGTRRKRLWELSPRAHCPVVGVCLPLKVLRRLVGKAAGAGGHALADDHALHSGAVSEARTRTRLAELLQCELDQRHCKVVRRAAGVKDRDALGLWWRQVGMGSDLPGALWAVLSHPRCDAWLEDCVLNDVHMLQHQLCWAQRGEQERLQALSKENGVLARELGAAQERCTRVLTEQARKIEQLQAQVVQLRAEVIRRDTVIAHARETQAALEGSIPGLRGRTELTRRNALLTERVRELERALAGAHEEARRIERRGEPLPRAVSHAAVALESEGAVPVVLTDRAVLCVGGRTASVPTYRDIVEGSRGRFLHHDGGLEDNVSSLDATLAAADMVICQAGCISHDAYWRVKDHCRRTGKQCVFVDQPGRTGLRRVLACLSREVPGTPPPGAVTVVTFHRRDR